VEYRWPGNVRELRNAIERAAILAEGKELTAEDLPEEFSARAAKPAEPDAVDGTDLNVPFSNDFRADRKEFERRYIARTLDEADGNVTRAASVLGMHRQSLQPHKLRELGLARLLHQRSLRPAGLRPHLTDNRGAELPQPLCGLCTFAFFA